MSESANRIDQFSPLQRAVFALRKTQARLEQLERERNAPVALIGMACRFPGGAADPRRYWQLLCDGADAIGEIPPERWDVEGFYDPDPQAPGKMNSRHGGFLPDIDLFDNHFFGISDEEAALLDPQQRLLLEVTWEALEDAGIPPGSLAGTRTGVFLGISNCEYSLLVSRNPERMVTHFSTGTALSIAANRISHVLDLQGPSMAIDTACSSSLVALHLATQALRNGDCETAIVAGASLICTPAGTIVLTKTGMSAPDGRVRAFDQAAAGYVRSEGVGALVLRTESAARGDQPYALIRGTAVGQTGRANGLSAPVGAVQEQTMRAACAQAGIAPGRIAYVETQGTGTLLGDAIEAKALGVALSDGRAAGTSCPIGSVKTNIGHLEAASGIASLMKVALSLKHGEVPASLHFASPNPMIPFHQLPIRVATRRESLPTTDGPAVASVNGFGYGGSTVHVILEAPPPEATPPEAIAPSPQDAGSVDAPTTWDLLPISARTETALRDLAAAYRDFLRNQASRQAWSAICATALHRREHHDCRLAVSAESAVAAADQIDRYLQSIADGLPAVEQDWRTLAGRRPYERHERKAAVRAALAELEGGGNEQAALARLYLAGGDRELHQRKPWRENAFVRLPHYVWQRKRHWTDEPNPYAAAETAAVQTVPTVSTLPGAARSAPRPRPDLNTPYTEPSSELQRRIAAAWSRVLDVHPVGIHDNFFELGGQSLQAAMLIHEVQRLTGAQLELIALFELQTVHELAAYLESHHGDAVAASLRSEDGVTSGPAEVPPPSHIPRAARDQPLPLSFGQQRFWILDQLAPGAAIYNTHLCVPLHGALDPELLREALAGTVARHESLRTVIRRVDGTACQQILEPGPVELPLSDLAELDDAHRQREVNRLSQEQAGSGFQLHEPPLFRFRLLRLSDAEHVLLLTVHHIVIDGVSLAILLRDVMEFYAAGLDGRAPALPELPVQYADFAVWQRAALHGETRATALAYWRPKLAGVEPLQLHFDRPRSVDVPARSGSHKFTIPPDLFQRLQAVCRQHHVTPFMLTLAAFKVLLSRYSGRDDVVVGTPVAGRGRRELADVVGFFVNTLAVRTDLSGDPSAAQLLGRVRAAYLEALQHQDLPFDQLAQELEPDRAPNRHPVFQVLFNYLQHVTVPTSLGDRLSIGQIPAEQPPHGGEFDLVLVLAESGGALDAMLGFNAALFDQATIQRIGGHLTQMLERMADALAGDGAAATPISTWPLVTADEQRQLSDWSGSPIHADGLRCVHQSFEDQAARSPDAIAVTCDDRSLTYRELNARANQLAHYLRRLGIGSNDLVAIYLERSVDVPVAVLATWKAGAAFVPLDPDYPQQRVSLVLDDCQPRAVLTQTGLAEKIGCSGATVLLDRDLAAIEQEPADNPGLPVTLQDLAYVVYTSGSTGKPKGAMNHHLALANYVDFELTTFGFTPDDRFLSRCPFGFDVIVIEFCHALLSGGHLVMANADQTRDPGALARLIQEQQLTVANFVPIILEAVLKQPGDPCLSLRKVLAGGDVLTPEIARLYHAKTNGRLINLYGPAEAAITASFHECEPTDSDAPVPIGRPIANTRLYILDPRQNPVPVGVEGELYIGGLAVGSGYLNRPELTAEKFVADPFLDQPGATMYRTGDRVRWLADGSIAFLGRLDNQVKIRGNRIEIGEIEAVIGQYPGVESAAADVRKLPDGQPAIVAYLVPSQNEPWETDGLRAFAQRRLPPAMQPASYVMVDRIPLSPNRKIDRSQLPDPDWKRSRESSDRAPAKTPTERRLATIWQALLGIDQVGVHDNFFELGGHSLLATQLIAKVNQEFETDLRLRVLFESPTIAALAAVLQEASMLSGPAVPLQRADRDGEIPLMLPQESQWLVDEMSAGPSAYSMNSALKLAGPLDVTALEAAINEVLRRHESLRTTFPAVAGRPVQRIHAYQPQKLEVTDVSHLPNPDDFVATRLDELNQREIDLQQGPILALQLLRLADEQHVLVIAGHHILFDAWSAEVLLREIFLAYDAFRNGQRSPLGELPYQCADIAVWQRQVVQSDETARRLAYWRNQLHDVPRLELPITPRRQGTARMPGAVYKKSLPPALGQAVREFCRQHDATPFMVTMAAFQVVLARLGGQRDFAIGTPVAGRMRRESQDLIGCFVNPVVLRCRWEGDPTFAELLSSVRADTLAALDHEVPFETLVESLNPARAVGEHPYFQVLFVFRQLPGRNATRAAGLSLSEVPAAGGVVPKFDLTLYVNEQDGELQVAIEYDRRSLDADTIDRLSWQFEAVLTAAVSDADRVVSQLPMISDAERRQLLVDGSGPATGTDALTPVHHLFEQQAARTPHAVAAVCCGESLTYAELNERANQAANLLRSLGVGPETRVGVQLPRCLDLVVSVLAVFKAGGAWVPLDPNYPVRRLDFMREDSAPALLLAHRAMAASLGTAAPVIYLDDESRLAEQSTRDPAPLGSLEDACYVMYTSGSTGQPKAAVLTHRGLANLMAWDQRTFKFSAQDRFLVRTPIGFDVFIQEFFRPLLAGGRIVLAGDQQYNDPAELVALVQREQLSAAFLVPALWNAFLDVPGAAECASLRHVSLAGEALSRSLMQKHFATLAAPLFNLYGPVEATVVVSAWQCDPDYPYDCVPIGKPIDNVRLYILDEHQQPVPVGVAGELFIGGAALAREYLGRPELTAARFLPDPLADDPAARMYRTGDRCRRLPDGNIEFLGRLDTQVKIRGVRIELEEIESHLKRHPEVRDAVVDVRRNARGDDALVAYLVCGTGQANVLAQLRSVMKDHLVEAMRPTAYLFVDEIPLSPHGKIDRAALPDPGEPENDDRQRIAPVTPTQARLAEIWKLLLGVERVGIHDNFFELGGHSLLAARLASQATEVCGATVRMRMVFEEPTIAGLARRIDGSAHNVQIDAPPIQRVQDRQRDFPLSSVQESMWLIHEISDGAAPYAVGGAIRLRGALDRQVLADAIDAVVQRHEALRTCYLQQDGKPVQRVLALDPLPLPVTDLSDLEPSRREAAAWDLARQEMTRTIDLTGRSIIQTRLLALDQQTHWLVVSGHHIAFDAWSLEILEREIGQAYAALSAGNRPSFAKLPVQYADYAVWQRERVTGKFRDELLGFWREQLADVPPLQLPQRQEPPATGQTSGRCEKQLSAEVTQSLRRFCLERDVTPFMLMHGVYQALLARVSGQEDFAIGTPMAGRVRPEVSELIGCFINPVAIRCDLSDRPSLASLLERVKQSTLAAFDHQEMPFGELVQELKPPREQGRHSIFQVGFNYLHGPAESRSIGGLTAEPIDLGDVEPKFELMLNVTETTDRLRMSMSYQARLLDEKTIQGMLEQFEQILVAGMARPEEPLADLFGDVSGAPDLPAPPSNSDELAPPDLSHLRCAHQQFESWAAETPGAVAVVCGGQVLTYEALNARANQLAAHLLRTGAQADGLIGIHLPHCLELPIAILGVLKAGAAVVLLDPDQPPQRLALILDDCRPDLVLSNRQLAGNLDEDGPPTVCLDDGTLFGQPAETENLPSGRTALRQRAYVVYTSGSTGVPKGAVNHHLGLANLLANEARIYGFGTEDRFLVRAPIGFDVFLNEFWRPFSCGGRMVLASPDQYKDAAALVDLVRTEGVTFAQIVPALLKAFLEAVDERGCDSLRIVLAGGDVLTKDIVALHRQRLRADLYNRYGPAETAVSVTNWLCRDNYEHDCLPIGRPYTNVHVYVLDDHQQPVEDGQPGELCIGGIAVGYGYLNRTELTAEKFLPDPFAPPGGRMYRSGDMCRRLPDGNIEFLGRRDQQVKVRGVRIELGEIEAALKQHADVANAVVDVRNIADERQLVGYVVPRAGSRLDFEQLRAFVEARLPASMRPVAYLAIDMIPLSHHGKIDRRALPDPQAGDLVGRRSFVAPRAGTEAAIAAVWRNVLQLDEVGSNDDFFAIGGHSLRVTQVVSRLNDAFGTSLRPRNIFEHPTIAGLAEHVEHSQRGNRLPAISISADRGRDFPLSFMQEALWLITHTQTDRSSYTMRAKIRFRGRLRLDALLSAIDLLRQRHEALRTTFPEVDGVPVQRVAPYAPAPIEVIDLTHTAADQRESHMQRLIDAEDAHRIDLRHGPIVRIRLYRISESEHVLLVIGHHIIFDGWSSELLPREIGAAYLEFLSGRQPRLPDVPAQPADFAAWQRVLLTGRHEEELAAYWRGQLADIQVLEMPQLAQQPAPANIGGVVDCVLPADLAHAIQTFCREHDVTPYMFTLASLQIVLARYSGQDEFAIGTPTAGRIRPELEGAIGCFVNLLPMRCDLTGGPTFADFLERTKTTTVEAFDHQEMPFIRMVELLSSRDYANRVFQTTFQYRHIPTDPLPFRELEITQESALARASRFELEFEIMDRGGELELTAHFDTRKFDHDSMQRLLDQYLEVMRAGIASPSTAAKQLAMLPPWERQRLLVEWNDTQSDLSGLRCAHQTFERQVEQAPDACAIICEANRLTYRELNSRANQLAHYLRGQGVGKGDLVGMLLARSVDVPVAALAIWKAGAVFVPLDPDNPRQRLALVLEDCRPRAVVSTEALAEDWGDAHKLVLLDRDRAAIQRQSIENPAGEVDLEDSAFVIYTSGSTGIPKGTINHHRGLANLITHQSEIDGLSSADRVLSRCNLGFDVFLEELLCPLTTGGLMVLAGAQEYADPAAMVRLIQEHQITYATLVPAILKALLHEIRGGECESVRHISVGGDVLTLDVVQMHHEKLSATLMNVYGPAETAVWVTGWTCDPSADRVSIGRPIRNCRIYILDEYGNPTPIGVEGELHVGGVAVGRGYLNRPELTAEKFLPDPFSPEPAKTMYRSGDRARWLADGNIEFLGRRDNQVKIRGVRIEIGEVESVLKAYPGIADAAADVRALPDGERAIAAYVVQHAPDSVSFEELRRQIQQRLPTAMQPASYTVVERLPLSPNGKVDRRQLPDPQWTPSPVAADSVMSETETERRLAAIWQEVLGLDVVGVYDNFFELGGHSLLAVKTMSRIRRDLCPDLPLAKFFTAPTIAQLATEIERARGPAARAGNPSGPGEEAQPPGNQPPGNQPPGNQPPGNQPAGPLVHLGTGRGPALFLVHGLGGYVTNFVPLGRELRDCCDVFAIEAQGIFDQQPPHDRIPEMAARYVAAVRQQQPTGPYLLAGWSMGGTVAWEMCRQLMEAGQTVTSLTLLDAYPLRGVSLAQRSEFITARLLPHLGPAFADIADLPKQQRWQAIVDRAHAFTGPGAETIRRLVLACEAHQKACMAYDPEKLDVDVVAFWAQRHWGRFGVSQWRKRARGYQARTVPGDHYGMLQSPHVQNLADEIRQHLQHLRAGAPASRKAG